MAGPKKHRFSDNGRGGHEAGAAAGIVEGGVVGEAVGGEDLELAAGFEDIDLAFEAKEKEFSIRVNGTGAEFSIEPPPPDFCPGRGFDADDETVVHREVDEIVDDDGRGIFGEGLFDAPLDVGVGHDTRAAGLHGDHFRALAESGDDDETSVMVDGPGSSGISRMIDTPEFLARAGIVAVGGLRSDAAHDGLSVDGDNEGRSVSLAQVAFLDRLFIDVFVIPDRGAVGFPDGLSGGFVEADNILKVGSIEGEDEKVFEEQGRGGGAAVMVALQVVALPDDLPGGSVETGGPEMAVMHVNASGFNDGRGGGVAVVGGAVAHGLGIVTVKKLFVGENFASAGIEAKRIKVVTVLRRGGQPDLIVQHDRRGETKKGDFRFPLHVFRFAPFHRQSGGAGVAVLVRTAVVAPAVGGVQRQGQGKAGEGESAVGPHRSREEGHGRSCLAGGGLSTVGPGGKTAPRRSLTSQ